MLGSAAESGVRAPFRDLLCALTIATTRSLSRERSLAMSSFRPSLTIAADKIGDLDVDLNPDG